MYPSAQATVREPIEKQCPDNSAGGSRRTDFLKSAKYDTALTGHGEADSLSSTKNNFFTTNPPKNVSPMKTYVLLLICYTPPE